METIQLQPQIDPSTGCYIQEALDVFEPPKVKKDAGKQVREQKADRKLWQTRKLPMQFDWISMTKESKARKRLEFCSLIDGDTVYYLDGNSKLDDRYERYTIRYENGRYSCSCQGHAYGDTRTLCTHSIAVALHKYERDEVRFIRYAGPDDKFSYDPKTVEEVADFNYQAEAISTPLQITEELISLVEQRNSQGIALELHPWLMHRPAVYLINWYPDKPAGFTMAATGMVKLDLDDPEILTPEELSERQSRELIEEWKYRQEVAERMAALLEKPHPKRWGLPDRYTELRDHQWEALRQILGAWCAGKKYVFVDAPTGAGKSIIAAITFLEWAGYSLGKVLQKGLLVVTSRDLQDQMNEDFGDEPWFAMIKGRLNYPTANFEKLFLRGREMESQGDFVEPTDWDRHVDCSDCEFQGKKHCRYCDPPGVTGPSEGGKSPCLGRCPYRQALKKVVARPLGLLNTAYLLRSCNSMAWGNFEDRSVLIVDEADTLESVMMGYVTVEVSEKKLEVLGSIVGRPEYKSPGVEARTDWFGWAGRAKARIAEIIERRRLQIKGEVPIGGEPGEDKIKITPDQKQLRRDLKGWEQLSDNLVILMESLGKGDAWIYDGYKISKEYDQATGQTTETESGPIIFKPVKIDKFTEPKLFKNFKNTCFLSATTISADQIARDLGINPDEYAFVEVPRTFDPARCPVYAIPVADNSAKEHENSWPALMQAVEKILMQNQEHRIFIHAVSYVQSQKLFNELKRRFPNRSILTHSKDSGSKKFMLKSFRKNIGAVAISPAMARGADFKGDDCRVQIIMKFPYLYLGDKQVSARLHGTNDGRQWYIVQGIRELVQMTGRNVRSETDWGVNFILDKQFLNVWNEHQHLFPLWWRQSLQIVRPGDW